MTPLSEHELLDIVKVPLIGSDYTVGENFNNLIRTMKMIVDEFNGLYPDYECRMYPNRKKEESDKLSVNFIIGYKRDKYHHFLRSVSVYVAKDRIQKSYMVMIISHPNISNTILFSKIDEYPIFSIRRYLPNILKSNMATIKNRISTN